MPFLLTDFIIRQPRVPQVNHIKTLPPQTSGSYTLSNAFTIQYVGGASTASMNLSGDVLSTLIDYNRSHPDNLDLNITGQDISSLIAGITANPNYSVTVQASPSDRAILTGVSTANILSPYQVTYGVTHEYLIEAENTAKLGTASVSWIRDNFDYQQLQFNWRALGPFTATGQVIPLNGILPIELGANMVFTPNPDNPDFDIAKLKTVVDEVLVRGAGSNVQFVTMSVLPRVVLNTLALEINNTPAVLDYDYSVSVPDNRINFIRGVANESHVLTEPSAFVDTNVQGVGGVITDSIAVTADNVPLVPNVDFFPQVSSIFQGKPLGSGRIYFTKTYVDDPVAEYVLTTEPALFINDLFIYKNGTPLDPSEYVIVLEAGFVNLNTPLFPGDIVTADYRSSQHGFITGEILAGFPASITNALQGPFDIQAGHNDTLAVLADGHGESITLPVGTSVTINDIISAYNAQASYSTASLSTGGTLLSLSSKTAGPSSTIQILPNNSNQTLGFTSLVPVNGSGSEGGEFAFTLLQAPVEITSFQTPKGGNTFFIRETDVSANYPVGAVVQIQADLYLVDSVSVDNVAELYSNQSTPDPYRIDTGLNDIFVITVDGNQYNVTLTSGFRTPQDVADDINLVINIASVEHINGLDRIKLVSPTPGIGGSLTVGGGSANQMLGFKNGAADTGLPNTRVTIHGTFVNPYNNPVVQTTRKSVTFLTETNEPNKSPPGTSIITFTGVDLTDRYEPAVLLNIGNKIYTVFRSQFSGGSTTVQLTTKLVAALYPTDIIQYTNRPVYVEGTTTLTLQAPPIPSLPIIVKNNGNTLIQGTDWKLNDNGSITLSDPNALNSNSNITATYTVYSQYGAGTDIKLTYRFFSNLNEGSTVTASYQYISPDQFFFDVVYENDLAQKVFTQIQQNNDALENPSSSGFSTSTGGTPDNSSSGNKTPKLSEYEYRYNDGIGKKIFDFLDRRIKAFTDEKKYYDGSVVGANSGPVTETDIQNVNVVPSRLFPTTTYAPNPITYTKTVPNRVPALDALPLNDNGTGTGGTNGSFIIGTPISAEETDISNETYYIDQLLLIPTGHSVSVNSMNFSSVTFFDGTGFCTPPCFPNTQAQCALSLGIWTGSTSNNVLNFSYNNTPYTVTFVGSASGTITPLASVISQINAVLGIASDGGGHVKLTSSTNLQVTGGSANGVLGFPTGEVYTREGSPYYAAWQLLLQDEITKIGTEIPLLTSLSGSFDTVLEEYLGIYAQSFDETLTQKQVIDAFISNTYSFESQTLADMSMDVQIDANLINRRDVTNANRIASINSFFATIANRLTEISNSLTREDLLNKRYAWLDYRTNRGTGTVEGIKRQVDGQTASTDKIALNKSLLAT